MPIHTKDPAAHSSSSFSKVPPSNCWIRYPTRQIENKSHRTNYKKTKNDLGVSKEEEKRSPTASQSGELMHLF